MPVSSRAACRLLSSVKCQDECQMSRAIPLSRSRAALCISPLLVDTGRPCRIQNPSWTWVVDPAPWDPDLPRCAESEGLFLLNPHCLMFCQGSWRHSPLTGATADKLSWLSWPAGPRQDRPSFPENPLTRRQSPFSKGHRPCLTRQSRQRAVHPPSGNQCDGSPGGSPKTQAGSNEPNASF